MKKYKYIWPHITKSTKKAIISQIEKGEISIYNRSGIFEKFENNFAKYYHKQFALLFSSGTAALHAAMVGCNFQPGDEVICPVYTFFASVTPIFQTGAIPVLCDAGGDGNIDPEKIEGLINKKTKALVVTHMWGIPCRMNKIMAIAKKHHLKVIEDASHAHGATFKGKLCGSFGNVGAFSLQGPKIISGGEGGVLITNEREIYERALLLGHYNKRCKQEITQYSKYYRYAITSFGLKLRAHPLAIAMANEQFSHLNKWHKAMNTNARFFTEQLKAIPGLSVPHFPKGSEPSWYAYTIQLDPAKFKVSTKILCQELLKEGVDGADTPGSTCPLNLLALFQNPSPLFPAYKNKVSYKSGDFPVAEKFFAGAIKFPIDYYDSANYRSVLKNYAKKIRKVINLHLI